MRKFAFGRLTLLGSVLAAMTLSLGVAAPVASAGASGSPRIAPGFSGGWEYQLDGDGNVIQSNHFVTTSAWVATNKLHVTATTGPGGPSVSYTFGASGDQGIAAGTVYTSDDGADADSESGCAGAFLVDQIVTTGTTVSTLGAQYDLICGSTSTEVIGEIAINLPIESGQGYYLYDDAGDLSGFGNNEYLTYLGALGFSNLNAPIVGMATTPDGGGYWMLGGDGGVFTYGDAQFYGSTGNLHLNQPVVGMAATPDGRGYWFVAADGGIFSYGDAQFYGSTGSMHLNQPIVGMTATPDGKGYWLVAADGGIFSYGDAQFYGSTGNLHLNKPIVGMTASPDGKGYWFVASDGGVFNYGDAKFHGSAGALPLQSPIVGMQSTTDGNGYWLVADDGGVFNYGDARFLGSLGGSGNTGIAGVTVAGRGGPTA